MVETASIKRIHVYLNDGHLIRVGLFPFVYWHFIMPYLKNSSQCRDKTYVNKIVCKVWIALFMIVIKNLEAMGGKTSSCLVIILLWMKWTYKKVIYYIYWHILMLALSLKQFKWYPHIVSSYNVLLVKMLHRVQSICALFGLQLNQVVSQTLWLMVP